jgi:polar amino acid transport system substrate-binding protein
VAIEVMKKLTDVLGVRLECVDTTWDYIIAGLQAGKWDIAAALNATPARTLVVDFSLPFYYYQVSFVYKNSNRKIVKPTSVADFDKEGIKLAVMSGTAQDKALTRAIRRAQIVRFPTVDETRMAVISGRVDALADDDATNNLFAKTYDWARTCVPNPPLSREGVAFGFRKGYHADIQTLDVLIQSLRNTGELREWEIKYGTILK